jgi:hypothetical protein
VDLGDFNTFLSPIDRSSKQTNEEIKELNHTIDQADLPDVYRIFHPPYTFFTAAMELSPKLIIS